MENLSNEVNENVNNIKKDENALNDKKNRPSKELIEALKEANDIISGKVNSKTYHNVDEMFKDILNEE